MLTLIVYFIHLYRKIFYISIALKNQFWTKYVSSFLFLVLSNLYFFHCNVYFSIWFVSKYNKYVLKAKKKSCGVGGNIFFIQIGFEFKTIFWVHKTFWRIFNGYCVVEKQISLYLIFLCKNYLHQYLWWINPYLGLIRKR